MIPSARSEGGIMMLVQASPGPSVDQDVAAVQGGTAYLAEIASRLTPCVGRAEPRQRALASLRGLPSPAERTNSWPVAEVSGDATPYGVQHLRRRARWDPEAVRDARRRSLLQQLGDPAAVLVIEETGLLKKGRHSAGGGPPSPGTPGP